jgi:hypothetical protein
MKTFSDRLWPTERLPSRDPVSSDQPLGLCQLEDSSTNLRMERVLQVILLCASNHRAVGQDDGVGLRPEITRIPRRSPEFERHEMILLVMRRVLVGIAVFDDLRELQGRRGCRRRSSAARPAGLTDRRRKVVLRCGGVDRAWGPSVIRQSDGGFSRRPVGAATGRRPEFSSAPARVPSSPGRGRSPTSTDSSSMRPRGSATSSGSSRPTISSSAVPGSGRDQASRSNIGRPSQRSARPPAGRSPVRPRRAISNRPSNSSWSAWHPSSFPSLVSE